MTTINIRTDDKFPTRTTNGFTVEQEAEIEAGTAKTYDSAEEMMKDIAEARKQAKEGKVYSHKEVIKRLGL